MSMGRPVTALDSRSFGRGRVWLLRKDEVTPRISDDLKLFAVTFVGGFLFVSLLIA